jgi:hypothetical protein
MGAGAGVAEGVSVATEAGGVGAGVEEPVVTGDMGSDGRGASVAACEGGATGSGGAGANDGEIGDDATDGEGGTSRETSGPLSASELSCAGAARGLGGFFGCGRLGTTD